MYLISIDESVGKSTIGGIKDFNSNFLATKAKKGEQLVSMMPAITKVFDLMGMT